MIRPWLLAAVFLGISQAAGPPPSDILVIPRPTHVARQPGTFTLSGPVRIAARGPRTRTLEIAHVLRDHLSEATGLPVEVVADDRRADIVLDVVSDAAGGSPEAYDLTVTSAGVRITASDPAGLFWGVQTLRQLLPPGRRTSGRRPLPVLPLVTIHDTPRFAWRGSMLDTGRHFFSVAFIERYLDLLALYKMNVFHWHLTEDQGWRLAITRYPRLTSVGAWRTESDGSRSGGFYTPADVREIVEYARRRQITVVPEIEMPGHATAALVAYPEFSCTGESKEVPTTWGVFDDVFCPGREETFTFLEHVLDEVMALFPSTAIHIGGDEVPKDHWKACPRCQQRMRNERLADEAALQSYFVRRIASYVRGRGREITGWDEILDGGLAEGATVQVWRDMEHARTTVRLGHRAVQSPASHTYLNRPPNELPLSRVFGFEPIPAGLSTIEAARIRGGEAPIWTEHINEANFDQMVFPRLLAMAEALWSDAARDLARFERRMEEDHLPRLRALGVAPGPPDRALARITPAFDPANGGARLVVSGFADGLVVRYTTDGTTPTAASPAVEAGTRFPRAGIVRALPFIDGRATVRPMTFTVEPHAAVAHPVVATPPNSPKYPGTGPLTLTDGLRGTTDFQDGLWHGWEGEDLDAVIDLGRVVPIRELELSALQVTRSWILLPRQVSFLVSDDGRAWRDLGTLSHDVPPRRTEPLRHAFTLAAPAGTAARFVRVRAANAGPLPAWHPGAGGRAWIFADEVIVRQ